MATIETLLEYLAKYGGEIISTNDLSPHWIEQARASNRLFVNEQSLGFVWEPKFKKPFPETVEEVNEFEKWYPLKTPLPEHLKNRNYERDKISLLANCKPR